MAKEKKKDEEKEKLEDWKRDPEGLKAALSTGARVHAKEKDDNED